MKFSLNSLAMGTLCLVAAGLPAKENADVDNISTLKDRLVFSGRVLLENDAAHWDWAGSQVSFNVDSPSVVFRIKDGKNDYNVLVNDEPVFIIETEKDKLDYRVELPGEGEREVSLTKRTGPNFEGGSLLGISLPAEGKWLDAPGRYQRRIEFIGDSYTVGYGNEGPGKECKELRPFENNWWSFASIAARELEAEGHMIAISGFGVVRNYGDKKPLSENPVPYFYDRTLKGRRDRPWDFTQWKADAVVIKLGSNDTSTKPHPSEKQFRSGYLGLVQRVRDAYGQDIPLFVISGQNEQPLRGWVESLEASMLEKGVNVTRLTFSPVQEDEWGCDWHPTVPAHKRFASELVTVMRGKLQWEESAEEEDLSGKGDPEFEPPPLAPLSDE